MSIKKYSEPVFIVICSLLPILYYKKLVEMMYISESVAVKDFTVNLISILIAILLLKLFSGQLKEEKVLNYNKAGFIPFFIFFVFFVILLLNDNLITSLNDIWRIIFQYSVGIVVIILTLAFIKIVRNFGWNLKWKGILIVLLIFTCYKIPYIVIIGKNMTLFYYKEKIYLLPDPLLRCLLHFAYTLLFTGFAEEILFRGFMFSGLKGFKLSDTAANLIQAIVFGLFHLSQTMHMGTGIYAIFSTFAFMLMGYLFGKLYIETKSLPLCILLHTLIDAI